MTIEFDVKTASKSFTIPDTIVNVWIIVIGLLIFAAIVNRKIKKANIDEKPSGFLNVIEMYVEMINGLVGDTMGKKSFRIWSLYIYFNDLYIICQFSRLNRSYTTYI